MRRAELCTPSQGLSHAFVIMHASPAASAGVGINVGQLFPVTQDVWDDLVSGGLFLLAAAGEAKNRLQPG